MSRVRHSLRGTACGFAAAVLVLAMSIAGDVRADPAADALSRLDELSRQALQTREAVTLAQRDVDDKRAAQTAAEDRHRADLVALDAANSQLASHQAAADKVAAMTYVSGRTGQMAAVLTAGSPQQLIDQLSLQRVVVAETAGQMKAFQAARERAAAAARASETSAADARAAAERSAAVRAELQAKLEGTAGSDLRGRGPVRGVDTESAGGGRNAAAPPPPQRCPLRQTHRSVAMPGQPPPDVVSPRGCRGYPGVAARRCRK